MNNENQTLNKIGEAVVQKFVNEEIMTKSELDQKLDAVMNKYVNHIDRKFDVLQKDIDTRFEQVDSRFAQVDARFAQVDARFDQVDKRFTQIDSRYNWIIGLIITAGISIIGVLVKLH